MGSSAVVIVVFPNHTHYFWVILKHISRQIQFSSTFQESPPYSSTFQACLNPGLNYDDASISTYLLWQKEELSHLDIFFMLSWPLHTRCTKSEHRLRKNIILFVDLVKLFFSIIFKILCDLQERTWCICETVHTAQGTSATHVKCHKGYLYWTVIYFQK